MKMLARGGRAFGRFWWDFLIGDTPEFLVATLAIVGVALLLRHQHDIAFVVLPLAAVICLVASSLRGRGGSSGTP